MTWKSWCLSWLVLIILSLLLAAPLALADSRARIGHSSLRPGEQATMWGPAKMAAVRQRAEAGHAQSQCLLAVRYEQGFDVPKNSSMAAVWYRRAADQGYAMAQRCLGMLYLDGRGVRQNFVRAYMWLSLSASRHDHPAFKQSTAKLKHVVGGMLSHRELVEARRLSRSWRPHKKRVVFR